MRRHEELYLVDLVEAAARIAAMVQDLDLEAFRQSKTHPSAVLWQLTVIGEAAGRLSEQTRSSLAGVPWTQIRAFRNRLVHGYFDLNWETVWRIATVETPELLRQVKGLLTESYPETYDNWMTRDGR